MSNFIVKTTADIDQQEPRSFNARVLNAEEQAHGMVDYATAFTMIDNATKHLKRAIPNGQEEACKIAASELATGMALMFAYLGQVVPNFQTYIESTVDNMKKEALVRAAKHPLTGA